MSSCFFSAKKGWSTGSKKKQKEGRSKLTSNNMHAAGAGDLYGPTRAWVAPSTTKSIVKKKNDKTVWSASCVVHVPQERVHHVSKQKKCTKCRLVVTQLIKPNLRISARRDVDGEG